VFLNGYPGASTMALRKGFRQAGAEDNEILIFSRGGDQAAARDRQTDAQRPDRALLRLHRDHARDLDTSRRPSEIEVVI